MKKLKEQTLNIRLTTESYNKLKQLAEKLDCSCGWLIRQAITEYLSKEGVKNNENARRNL